MRWNSIGAADERTTSPARRGHVTRRVALPIAFGLAAMCGLAAVAPAAQAAPADVHPDASKCAWLSAPGGGEADLCRSWYANGDGTYYGELQVTNASSRVYTQVYEDGEVITVAGRGQSNYRSYDGFHHVYQRVCNSGCGGWW